MANVTSRNLTALNHDLFPGWMAPPTTRGTSQVLYGCLLTISICIYNSIHLNIPEPGEKKRWQVTRRVKWAVVGVFAPELVLFAAWEQYRQAQKLILKMCDVAPDLVYMEPSWWHKCRSRLASFFRRTFGARGIEHGSYSAVRETTRDFDDSTATKRRDSRHKIDLSYGFYAVMGGLRVDTSSLHDDIPSLALSFEKLIEILDSKHELAPEVIKSLLVDLHTIQDRSKANNLTKILICCQVLGTAFQCIVRKAYGLPLALLELHTFAHVVCAIGIYTVWFKKPLDVNEFVTVNLPDAFSIGLARALVLYQPKAWKYDLTDVTGEKQATIVLMEDRIDFHITQDPKADESHNLGALRLASARVEQEHRKSSRTQPDGDQNSVIREHYLKWDEARYAGDNNIKISLSSGRISTLSEGRCSGTMCGSVPAILGDNDKRRWEILSSHTDQVDCEHDGDYSHLYALRRSNYFGTWKQWTLAGHREWNTNSDPYGFFCGIQTLAGHLQIRLHLFSTLLILALYGGCHALAWTSQFPSDIEMWLWRGSCIVLVSFAPTFLAITALDGIAIETEWFDFVFNYIWIATVVLSVCAYILARILVVIETLISLRTVPVGVYSTIPWTQYLPHL